ncbi:MAG TPA: hypothetical protein VI997_11200 [Candidatus Thermoplasmatota archaeon]|nr:hypothetical protein [Candidatus Thermoplasmatota archaeon]
MIRVDHDRLATRFGLAAVAAFGALLLVSRSFLYQAAPGIPWGFVPDMRPLLVLGIVGGLGAAGAFVQGARTALLWTVVLLALVFELDHATVHWFSDFPGTLVGGRLDPIRTAGGIVAIGATLLLHADVAAEDERVSLAKRGVPDEESVAARASLAVIARRRVVTLGAIATGSGAVVLAADLVLGDATAGPGTVGLAIGVAVLATLAVVVVAPMRRRAEGPRGQDTSPRSTTETEASSAPVSK